MAAMKVNLVLVKKNGSTKNISLPSSVTVIGRSRDRDLVVLLESVSRRHCQLNHDKGVLKIRDLGSRNGTILNGKRIEEAVIQQGDDIVVGPLTFVFQIDGKPEKITLPPPVVRKPAADKSRQQPGKKAGKSGKTDELGELADDINLDELPDDLDLGELSDELS